MYLTKYENKTDNKVNVQSKPEKHSVLIARVKMKRITPQLTISEKMTSSSTI